MKKTLSHLIIGFGLVGTAMAQNLITGPSTTTTPYMWPSVAGGTVVSILTAGDVVGGYTLSGLGDGIGAIDNGGNTFTVVLNHEMGNGAGAVHAHGQTGAYVSKLVISKSNLQVNSISDLIQDVKIWTGTTYTTYNSANTSTLAQFGRFCSGDLAKVTAYYNPATGKGTQDRMLLNGEETGAEGRAFAHIVTGAEAGVTYQLPHLGRCSFENNVASPFPQDKTIVVGLDDSTPGQVYVYIGNKSASGNTIEKAGLFGGRLYGVSVLGLYNEVSGSIPAAGTTFTLVDLGLVQNTTGANLQTNSANYGVTNFLRPEDGAWDPNNPRDFYFVTTNSFTSPSRMWRLRFTDITNPELGGTITAVLDGTEGPKMMDNLTVDNNGHILIQEDPGGNNHRAKVWQYKISTDAISLALDHDSTRFQTGGANYITIDEEASGVIDMQGILGAGWFLQYDQIHSSVASPVVEMGQLQAFFNPATAAANPEINIQGNSVSIVDGSSTTSGTNGTSFGLSNVGSAVTRTFIIQNTNSGTLIVSSLKMTGANAGDFVIAGPGTPFTINGNNSQSITVTFVPPIAGTRNAILNVTSSDWDENIYDFAVQGTGAVAEIDMQGNNISIADGNTSISTGDNTDFGTVIYNTPVIKEFKIQNTGNGTLTVSGINLSGANMSDFTFMGLPSFPLSLAGSAIQTFSIQYLSAVPNSTSNAIVNVISSDADEANYDFAISGSSLLDVGLTEIKGEERFVKIFPNPAMDEVNLNLNLQKNGSVLINVYDIQGKKVMTVSQKEVTGPHVTLTLNTAPLENGEYIIEISANGKINRQKLVVLH